MKIEDIEYFRLDMPLSVPYTIAYETVSHASNIILKVITDTGITGWGCAAPDITVTGEGPEDVIRAIDTVIKDRLKGRNPFRIARITHDLKKVLPHASSAMAMVDMALYDTMARKAELPLYQMLGGFRKAIPTSITIGILPLGETIEQAKKHLNDGFTILKLKGGLNLSEDIEKVLKLREKLGKAVSVPVMADESIKTLKDAFRLASNDRIDMINIKLMKMGGIFESQHINSVAKAAGLEVMVGCLDESALGISAGLHFALSRANIEFADLDGHLDLLNDPFSRLFHLKNGILTPADTPGLGQISL